MVKNLVKIPGEGCSDPPSLLDLNDIGFKVRILSPRVFIPGRKSVWLLDLRFFIGTENHLFLVKIWLRQFSFV